MPQTTLSYLKSLLECILYRITSGLLQKVILNFRPPSILRTNVPWQMGWPFSASHWNGETSWGRLCSQWWEKGKKLSKICGVPPALHKSDSPLQYYLPISSWNTLLRGLGLSCRELIINEVKTKPNRLQTPQCMTEAPDPRGSSPLWLPWLPGCLETPVGGRCLMLASAGLDKGGWPSAAAAHKTHRGRYPASFTPGRASPESTSSTL